TKEQYEELGRFAVAFEDMVNDVRELCIFILAGFNLSQQTFVSVAFHHRVLTAQPLFEIMQTLIAEVAKDKDAWTRYKIDDESATIINGVIAAIRGAYDKLASIGIICSMAPGTLDSLVPKIWKLNSFTLGSSLRERRG